MILIYGSVIIGSEGLAADAISQFLPTVDAQVQTVMPFRASAARVIPRGNRTTEVPFRVAFPPRALTGRMLADLTTFTRALPGQGDLVWVEDSIIVRLSGAAFRGWRPQSRSGVSAFADLVFSAGGEPQEITVASLDAPTRALLESALSGEALSLLTALVTETGGQPVLNSQGTVMIIHDPAPVAMTSGISSYTVTGLGLGAQPVPMGTATKVRCWLSAGPTDPMVACRPQDGSLSLDGFIAQFGAALPNANYKLNYEIHGTPAS